MAMIKVWVLYKEQETDDINHPDIEDVEIFAERQTAEQAAYWLNSRLSDYDQYYNGWHVGEERVVK